ncbi:YdeI/OmpD-associated family protein [Cellulomonas massiliensis]|uniref:YdeI/OmpD-associated family protein n=1 Tax=Cellulomonas massiliensis TaxID=1465811 RepID=UPI0002EE60E9|nr:YdeI/OmpD-associated family protein [Cellulomonas massiliensis]
MTTFRATLERTGGTTVGIVVPDEVVAGLGAGRRPAVLVRLNGYEYRTTVGSRDSRFLLPVSAAVREAAGVAGGEEHDVTVTLDDAPRTVEVPEDLAGALAEAGARERFDALAPSHRREHVRSVVEAKAAATRERRIAAVVARLVDTNG